MRCNREASPYSRARLEREFQLAQPNRIRVIRATADTRVAVLAEKSPIPKYAAEQIRLLNDLYPDKEPSAGQYVKVVVQ